MNASIRRLLAAIGVLGTLVLAGGVGFFILGHGRWTLLDCLYMTVITLSTVGFAELSNMGQVPGARGLTVLLIVSGVGALAYVQGNLTALLVEGVIGTAWRRNRMNKQIASLSGHIVVAGCGATSAAMPRGLPVALIGIPFTRGAAGPPPPPGLLAKARQAPGEMPAPLE